MLPGENKRRMMEVDVNVSVDKDGVFQGVIQGDKTMSVSEWNQQFENKNPKGN